MKDRLSSVIQAGQRLLILLDKPLMPRSWWPAGLLIGVVLVVLLLDYSPLHDPIAQDSSLLSVTARVAVGEMTHNSVDLKSGTGILDPMLYQVLLNTLARSIGSQLIFARLMGLGLGLLTALLTGWLVMLIKRHQSSRRWPAVFAIAAFLTNPFGRLGMLHLDIDTSVLPPILLALTGVAILIARRFKPGTLIFLAGLQALAFWAKLTTPLLAPLGLAFRLRLDRKNWSVLWIPATLLLGGGTLFALSWAAYSSAAGYSFEWLYSWISGAFAERAGAEKDMVSLLRHLIGMAYWLNPAFLTLWIACTWRLFAIRYNGQETRELKLLALIGWGIVVGYVVIGGWTYTIPKYQYPAIPLISILVAVVAVPRLKFSRLILVVWGIAILAIGGYYYALGDPLYRLFYEIRAHAWTVVKKPGVPPDYVLILFKDLLLVLLPLLLAVAYAFLERPEKRLARLVPILVVIGIGYNLGLGIRQGLAPYATTYSYGMQDTERVLEQIKEGAHVLVYEGALFGPYNDKHLRFMALDLRGGVDEITENLQKTEADYLLVGLSINTLDQLLSMQRYPDLSGVLQSRFLEHRIGDFILFDRQSRPR